MERATPDAGDPVPWHQRSSGAFRGRTIEDFPSALPAVPTWAHWLATNNGCNAEPIRLPDHGKASGIRYAGGTNAAEVVFYTVRGGGHTWPGGKKMPAFLVGFTPSDISATRLMWDFFQQHHLGK
jgi:polyhydroxybutyrate depolymerase